MRYSDYLKLRLPEQDSAAGRNDPADIDDLTFDFEAVDRELAAQAEEAVRLGRDKADRADLTAHINAPTLAHPDGSVTDEKLGDRSIHATTGKLGTLLEKIGDVFKALTGGAAWDEAPPLTLREAKAHLDSRQNPHAVTKAQVGLASADDTPDAEKPVSGPQALALEHKVDKEAGKGLSHNDYSDAERQSVADSAAARHTHGNKIVLDGISADSVAAWEAAHTHIQDAVRHITAAERSAWNTAKTKVEAAVPNTRRINGKPLSADLSLTPSDLGALAADAKAASAATADAVAGSCLSCYGYVRSAQNDRSLQVDDTAHVEHDDARTALLASPTE